MAKPIRLFIVYQTNYDNQTNDTTSEHTVTLMEHFINHYPHCMNDGYLFKKLQEVGKLKSWLYQHDTTLNGAIEATLQVQGCYSEIDTFKDVIDYCLGLGELTSIVKRHLPSELVDEIEQYREYVNLVKRGHNTFFFNLESSKRYGDRLVKSILTKQQLPTLEALSFWDMNEIEWLDSNKPKGLSLN